MYNLTILNPKHKILNSYLLWNGKKNSSTHKSRILYMQGYNLRTVASDTPKKVETTGWTGHMSGWTGPY